MAIAPPTKPAVSQSIRRIVAVRRRASDARMQRVHAMQRTACAVPKANRRRAAAATLRPVACTGARRCCPEDCSGTAPPHDTDPRTTAPDMTARGRDAAPLAWFALWVGLGFALVAVVVYLSVMHDPPQIPG